MFFPKDEVKRITGNTIVFGNSFMTYVQKVMNNEMKVTEARMLKRDSVKTEDTW
jgi:hypothetical protein